MVTFKKINTNYTTVYSDGKRVGNISRVAGGYQYRPKGSKSKFFGEVYAHMDDCKNSLMGEN